MHRIREIWNKPNVSCAVGNVAEFEERQGPRQQPLALHYMY